MDMIDVHGSNQIESFGYDPETNKLRVKFADKTKKDGTVIAGGLYEYENVPISVASEFLATAPHDRSTGSHFHKHIRNAYSAKRI